MKIGGKMNKKILVIDDEELIVKSLAKLLEKTGFEVVIIKRGQDAIAIVEEENFDLLISDIRMPGMDGIEAVRNILNTFEQKKSPKPAVIFITGYADKESEQRAKSLNPAAYIYKPFDISTLVEKIN